MTKTLHETYEKLRIKKNIVFDMRPKIETTFIKEVNPFYFCYKNNNSKIFTAKFEPD